MDRLKPSNQLIQLRSILLQDAVLAVSPPSAGSAEAELHGLDTTAVL
jgi:hypothetical protein